jgi:hypothetical protein
LIQERRYLKNVTSQTLEWNQRSFIAFDGAPEPEAVIKQGIVERRDRGVSATSVNTRPRCINAELLWLAEPVKIPRLKEAQKVLAALNPDHVKRQVAFRQKGWTSGGRLCQG